VPAGAITYDYEVHKMLSSLKKISPGIDDIPYWVFKHCDVELTVADIFTDQIHVFLTALNQTLIALLFIY